MRRLTIFLFILFSSLTHAQDHVLKTPTQKIPIETLRGKWIFITYWATWCPPCLDEIVVLNQFHQTHQQENIMLFAVNYDGLSEKEQIALANAHHLNYESLIEDPAHMLSLGDIQHLPAMFIFNPKGELQDKKYGEQTLETLERYFLKLKKNIAQGQPLTQHAYTPSV